MTPLALSLARIPLGGPGEDWAELSKLVGDDLHCFDVTAISKPIMDAMDADNLWPDMVSMLPRLFLPSPVTWIEARDNEAGRFAYILEDEGEGWFSLSMAIDRSDVFTVKLAKFRGCSILENPDRVILEMADDMLDGAYEAGYAKGMLSALPGAQMNKESMQARISLLEMERDRVAKKADALEIKAALIEGNDKAVSGVKFGLVFSVLAIDLINTPGLIGLRQHDPHRGMAKRYATIGSYPLRGWSEVTLKHQTKVAGPAEQLTGTTYHKCLHFVRSHLRHYRNGNVSVIPAHWRGDPALGIKRTRYRMAA
jgi:hypothetical protein